MYLFTNTTDFEFSLPALILSGFGTKVTLASQKEVGSVLSFSIL